MIVTVTADASYCPYTSVGAYGYYVRSGRGCCNGGAAFPGTITTSIVAEMWALGNALYFGMREGLIGKGDVIVFETDCTAAIGAFKGQRIKLNSDEESTVVYVTKILEALELSVRYRHVRSHTRRMDRPHLLNNYCHTIAYNEMLKARQMARKKNVKFHRLDNCSVAR